MTVRKPWGVLLGFTLGVAAAVACGNANGSLSPTGPSPGGSGAVISGRVNGVSGLPVTANSTSFAPRATTSLHVTISGTDISTTVDGNGQFTLNGVPPGTITLQFSGPGVSANITLSGVTAGQQIQLEVTLTSTGARVDSETRRRGDDDNDDDDDDDDDDLTEVKGAAAGLTGTCPSLTFTIGTRTVKTTSATRFDDGCNRIQNNVRVEAKGAIGTDNVLTAARVELDD